MGIKGLILAGGKGTRLGHFTERVSNKHLAPVYDRVMIEYPMETLRGAGIKNITIVTSERSAGDIVRFVGDGNEFGFDSVEFKFQYGGDMGIADAIRQAGRGSVPTKVAVILGDNLFEQNMSSVVESFMSEQGGKGACAVVKFVPDPERYGVALIKDSKIVNIEEKPKKPKSSMAISGFYLFDERVFDIVGKLKKSDRGEYEVTDILKWYMDRDELTYKVTNKFWTDMGTYDSLLLASNWVRENRRIGDFEDKQFAIMG